MDDITTDQESAGKSVGFSSATNHDLYSSIASSWGSAIGAQHTLLAGYITAHSFLIAAVVLLFISFRQEHSTIVGIGVLLVSAVGILLSLQMALAWGRFVARIFLFEWHLQRIEKQYHSNISTVFTDWARIRDNPEKNLIDPRDKSNRFYANWSVKHHKKWWAARAKMIPVLIGIVYLFFFTVSTVNLGLASLHNRTAVISTPEIVTPMKQPPKTESSLQESSSSLSKEKPKTK